MPLGGVGEGHPLAVLVVGRVVGGNGVDGAVAQPLPHRLDIAAGAQRRRHLGKGAIFADRRFIEGEMVRGRFRRYRQAARLGAAYRIDGLGGRDV